MLNETSAPPCAQYDKLARDLETMGALGGVPILLHALCESSGMGFAAIGCVTGDGWMAGAVEDRIGLGLRRGDPFKVDFADSGGQGHSAVFAALRAPTHRYVLTIGGEHHVPIARYLWVAIILTGGRYVGNLCVIDPRPDETLQPWITPLLQRFSQLIAQEFDAAQNRVREHVALLDERAAGELREQFIAILGHDLRNPLQAVSAIGELLERRLDDPALAQMASRIRTNARRMFALIDDVLDFARGRLGGGIDVQLRDVDNIGGALLAVVQELQDAQPFLVRCAVNSQASLPKRRATSQSIISIPVPVATK